MLRNSNTIALQPQNSRYEEFTFSGTLTGTGKPGLALPGAVLTLGHINQETFAGNAFNDDGVYQANGNNAIIRHEVQGMRRGVLHTQAGCTMAAHGIVTPPLGISRPIIALENALLGTGLSKPSIPGSTIPCYFAADNDIFNVRCVEGSYYIGEPVYLTQTPNGLYATKTTGGPLLGYVEENYVVTPEMRDLIDGFNYETGAVPQEVLTGVGNNTVRYENLNGVLINLLRVRIMFAAVVAAGAP